MTDETTILRLHGIGVPPYSARNLSDNLRPIGQAKQLYRTVNGRLVDFSVPQFRRYAISIACTDQDPPACDGVWPGQQIIIDCVSELCYAESTAGPSREVVPGSERTADGFIFYRPRLTVLVTDFNIGKAEYGASVPWQLDAEEEGAEEEGTGT